VLLACSLSSYLATTDLSALTVIALGGAILAGAAVPSLESSLPWPAMIGVLALGLAASLATHWALTINTIPHVAILMTTWSSAIFVQALRSAGQPNARYFTAGMQFLTRPRSTELNDTNHSTTLS